MRRENNQRQAPAKKAPAMTGEANLRLWEAHFQTDPSHAKEVSFGRKFTTVDAYYQVYCATKEWGPVGDRWGWDVQKEIVHWDESNSSIFLEFRLRYPVGADTAKEAHITTMSSALWRAAGKVDNDAPKKCLTDCLTKALSYLGFNADLFFGLFDDNKYIEEVRKKFESSDEGGSSPATADSQGGSPPSPDADAQGSRPAPNTEEECGAGQAIEAMRRMAAAKHDLNDAAFFARLADYCSANNYARPEDIPVDELRTMYRTFGSWAVAAYAA